MPKVTRIKTYNYNQCSDSEQPCPAHAFEVEDKDGYLVIDKTIAKPGDFVVMNYLGNLSVRAPKAFHEYFDPVNDAQPIDRTVCTCDEKDIKSQMAGILIDAAKADWKVALACLREWLFRKGDK